ncbi:MAG: acetamidase/formamidase family protein [Planctomycetota bacterium]
MKDIYPQGNLCKLTACPEPICTVKPGQHVQVHTLDCFGNQLRPGDNFRDLIDKVANPVTGPIEITGAKAGDIVKVQIENILCADSGFATCGSGFGVLGAENFQDRLVFYRIQNGIVTGPGIDKLPVRPVVGTLGTWPEKEQPLTTEQGDYGGNLDTVQITIGSTLYLPVSLDGAMFFIGDLHALQGAGETHGGGMECAGVVQLSFSVMPNCQWPTPLIQTDKSLITVASDADLNKAIRTATKRMVNMVAQLRTIGIEEALLYCSLLGDIGIGQLVNSHKTAVFTLPLKDVKPYIDACVKSLLRRRG